MTRILPQHALGGMQKQTMDLCEGFKESGHKVTIFTTKRNDGVVFEDFNHFRQVQANIKQIVLPWPQFWKILGEPLSISKECRNNH